MFFFPLVHSRPQSVDSRRSPAIHTRGVGSESRNKIASMRVFTRWIQKQDGGTMPSSATRESVVVSCLPVSNVLLVSLAIQYPPAFFFFLVFLRDLSLIFLSFCDLFSFRSVLQISALSFSVTCRLLQMQLVVYPSETYFTIVHQFVFKFQSTNVQLREFSNEPVTLCRLNESPSPRSFKLVAQNYLSLHLFVCLRLSLDILQTIVHEIFPYTQKHSGKSWLYISVGYSPKTVSSRRKSSSQILQVDDKMVS